MKQIATTVNQEATAPTTSSSEYNLWLEFINRSYKEWQEANDWEELRKVNYPVITGVSQATVTLPLDFDKLAEVPRLYKSGGLHNGTAFPEALPEQQGLYGENDEYVEVRGNISAGYFLHFHPGTLASGASLVVEYFCLPTSLASPAEIPVVSDSQYLIDRTIAFIFEARSDARFQIEENKARERLLIMIENSNMTKFNSYAGTAEVITTNRRVGFRIGRDG